MPSPRGGAWKRTGRLAVAGKLAKHVWICNGCGAWHEVEKPAQCIACGRMDFLHFPSAGEAKHWARLRLLERAGDITDLRRQVSLPLMTIGPSGIPCQWGELIVDYAYKENGVQRYLDWKPIEGPKPETVLKVRCLEKQGIIVDFINLKGRV